MPVQEKIIISGAGIIGLLTAQALKQRGIDYVVFDRDPDVHFRESAGWAITLHWALDTFMTLLGPELTAQIYGAQVRKDFHLKDTGTYKYIDASNGDTMVSIPPTKRLRVRREQIRRILLQGIDVQWNCKLEEVSHTADGKVVARCASGQVFEGTVLLGCDGANSLTRRLVCGQPGELHQLPIRFCGAKVKMSKEEVENMSVRFDPLLFQGTVPANETFYFYSVLSMPDYSKEEDGYYAQVNLSWKIAPDEHEPFATNEEKAAALMKRAEGLHPDLYVLVERAASDPSGLVEVRLADWPEISWETNNGSVLLLGDAAHAMVMYRGEALNHGITDVADFVEQIDNYAKGSVSWKDAAANYCASVKSRAHIPVLLSRQACMDAHDMTKIFPESTSPLLSKRSKTEIFA